MSTQCLGVLGVYVNNIQIHTPMDWFGVDNKKVGMVMMIASMALYFLGIVLLFERLLIILGNVCFLLGMYLFIGLKGTFGFLIKKGKIQGSFCYFAGLFVILFMHMTVVGTLVQLAGFFLIFKSFLPDIYDYITKLPYVGIYLKSYTIQNFLDRVSTNSSNSRI